MSMSDKCRMSMRRSASRLIFPSSDTPSNLELSNCIHQFHAVAKASKAQAEAQRAAAESLLKWSLREENAAIKDVAFQTNELFGIWATCQLAFAEQLEQSFAHFNAIREAGKAVQTAQKRRKDLADKEAKLKKDIKKAEKWKKGGDVRLLQHHLQKASGDRTLAERQVEETQTEQEVVKMLRFRAGMEQMAGAYSALGQACSVVFQAHNDVVQQVPAISTQDIRAMVYSGAPITRDKVESIRSQLVASNSVPNTPTHRKGRASDPTGSVSLRRHTRQASALSPYDPPPPYAPTDPTTSLCPNCHYPQLPTEDSLPNNGFRFNTP